MRFSETLMEDDARRTELGAFLRTRRKQVQPAEVGLRSGVRRRTPGLRREEVAQLAGISITWYTWLEQGRPIRVSLPDLHSIARVLQLNEAEQSYFFDLAVPSPIPRLPADARATDRP